MVKFVGSLLDKDGNGVVGGAVDIVVTGVVNTTVSAVTGNDGLFTADYDAVPGAYNAVATFAETASYKAATSIPVPFIVDKKEVTITLNVIQG
jgi:hypothetical protein